MNALVYVDIRKNSKMLEMKNEKKYLGFSFYINIGDFEAFLWNLNSNLSTNHSFWRCEPLPSSTVF